MAGEKSKRKLGFITSALERESKFEETFSRIEARRGSWQELTDQVASEYTEEMATLDSLIESGSSAERLQTHLTFITYLMTTRAISMVGTSVSDVEARVSELQKAIESLRLEVK